MHLIVAKELRALLAIVLLLAALEAIGLGIVLVTEFPDAKPFSEVFKHDEPMPDPAVVGFFAILIATGLLVRETDEGTLTFLDGLPVSRARIFAGKVLAAMVVLAGYLVVDFAIFIGMHALSRTSLEKSFPWPMVATGFGLHVVLALSCLAVTLALSFLRRWLFLALGLIAWAFVLAKQYRLPHLALFDPFELVRPAIHDGRWVVPMDNLRAQAALIAAGLGVALAGFCFAGDRAPRTDRTPLGKFLGVLGLLLIPVIWLGLLVRMGTMLVESEAAERLVAPQDAIETRETAHYSFVFRNSQQREAEALIARADSVHAQVAAFLNASPNGRITVDTTSGLQRHNAGQAYWKKIRMLLPPTQGPEQLAAVLAHETTHVFLDQLSEFRLAPHFASVRSFHEGVASYVEHRFFRGPDELRALRRVAAVAHAWRLLTAEHLVDDDKLSRERDEDLAYPAGELFCAALIQCHGDAAPGKVARAFARRSAPKDLSGAALWRDTLQACGYDLERVLAAWRAELDRLAAEETELIEKLPRLSATVESTEREIVVRPRFTGAAPGAMVCTARPSADAAEYEHDFLTQGSDGVFRVRREQYPGTSFWYRLAWRVEGCELPVFEAWVEHRLE